MYNTIMNRFIKIRILLNKEDNMPKIIENLREELLAEAKKQIAERGYKNTTIRSVAAECVNIVGQGTLLLGAITLHRNGLKELSL